MDRYANQPASQRRLYLAEFWHNTIKQEYYPRREPRIGLPCDKKGCAISQAIEIKPVLHVHHLFRHQIDSLAVEHATKLHGSEYAYDMTAEVLSAHIDWKDEHCEGIDLMKASEDEVENQLALMEKRGNKDKIIIEFIIIEWVNGF